MLHILGGSCFVKISYFYVLESLFRKLYDLSNFFFNYIIFSSISSDWMLAAFIELSNLAWSFFIFDFNQLDFSLFYVTFACRLAFLSSRLKDWLGFLMKRFISSFLSICQFILLISNISDCFLPFNIALSWAFDFIGAFGVSLSLVSSLLKNRFFYATNELTCN